MKKIFILITIVLVTSSTVYSQTVTVDVDFNMLFDSSYVVGQGMVDSFDINQNFQAYNTGQFVLCDNSTFTFKGNQSSSAPSFYLYSGATLILKDALFYPKIYMKNGSIVNAQLGNQNIICYRESTTTLQDTSNVNWLTDSVVTQLDFTFSTWPNASAPCNVSPQSLNSYAKLDLNLFMNNSIMNYSFYNDITTDVLLYNVQGRLLLKKKILGSGQLDLSHYASGIYIVHFIQNGKIAKRKIVLD